MGAHRRDCVVVGAGHNGLIAACYLAAAGLDVEVIERDRIAGGAVSTVERWPGVRVDRGSSLHVMVRHTGIVEELDLASMGLRYDDADPFAVLPDPAGGPPLVLRSDLDATCHDLEPLVGAAQADGYRRFIATWIPRWRGLLALAEATSPLTGARAIASMARREWRLGADLPRQFLTTAEAAVAPYLTDDRLRSAIGWWASQAGPGPHEAGTAPIAGSLALMHLRPPGRPIGGSGRLADALAARLAATGGTLRLGDPVTAIETGGDGVTAVRTGSGDRIRTRYVVAACHAATTLRLLDRPEAADRIRVGDGIGLVLRLLTDSPPEYVGDTAPADRGMTLLVRPGRQLRVAAADGLAGEPSRDPPLVVMTPTVADPTLAPHGTHVVTVWSQWAPYRLATGDWDRRREAEADRVVAAAAAWAPGLPGSISDRFVQTPLDLERELGLVAGDVMHVTTGLDSIFRLRPLPGWNRRTPIRGLYLTGASTHPGGGVWGASGRATARVLLRDLQGRPWRSTSRPRADQSIR